jgi:Transposase DDE domain
LLSRLVAEGVRGVRIRRLGGDRAGEIQITRFLRNRAVTGAEMFAAAAERTSGRSAGRAVLAIQDTTVVKSEGGGGLYLHPTLVVDAEDGSIVGLAHAEFLKRTSGRKADRRERPIEDKESRRWLEGAAAAARVCASARDVTVVADRESDIYSAFARRPPTVHLIVRAAQDRALEDGERLFARLSALPEAGRAKLQLAARPGRPAREATLALRHGRFDLARPRNGGAKEDPAAIAVHLVDVREIEPREGENLHWRLITTRPIDGLAQALEVVDLYRRRWAIEQLFRTMKSDGFDIEGVRMADDAPRQTLAAATLIAAVTIQQLVHAREGGEAGRLRPLLDAFEAHDQPLLEAYCARLEGKTQRQKNPHPRGSLAYASWVIARLGGWTGYYGKPGPIVMLAGWHKFQHGKYAIALSQNIPKAARADV